MEIYGTSVDIRIGLSLMDVVLAVADVVQTCFVARAVRFGGTWSISNPAATLDYAIEVCNARALEGNDTSVE